MIGRILGGRYQVLERIGGGGMAIVYRGLDVLLHRPVSVKTLRPEYVGDADFVRRFKREAQAAASLSNASIVNIYDVGQDGEAHYIVMEYVDGKTLKQVIEERAPLPVDEAVGIARQICDALAHAHEHNIIHRDVKPHNILISKTGRVKVTDFGIARAISANTITHHSSSVLGSVHYFSPEQARGNIADAKSDVYSLGVVLYEMLTGTLPFSGETAISVALKHLQDTFIEPRRIAPRIPQSVENIVLIALMKDPAARYQSVSQFASDLDRALLLPDVPKFVASQPRAIDDSETMLFTPIVDSTRSVLEPDGDKLGDVSEVEENDPVRPVWQKLLIVLGWIVGLLVLVGVAALAAFYLFAFVVRPHTINTPNVIGMSYAEARAKLIRSGVTASQISESTDLNSTSSVQIGQVQSQNPGSGPVPVDQSISLVVKTGTSEIQMPDLTGLNAAAAGTQLEGYGVPNGNITITPQQSGAYKVNQVISTIPAKGTLFNSTTAPVTLVVSSGAQSAAVPDVLGKLVETGKSMLTGDGFAIGNTTRESSFSVPLGAIIKQIPAPGQQVNAGTSVDLTVSSGQPAGTVTTTANIQLSLATGTALPVAVRIDVTDAVGARTAVNTQQNSPEVTYPVKVTTTPTISSQISVYENGQLVQTDAVASDGTVTTTPYQTPGTTGTGTTGTGTTGTGTTGTGTTGTGTTGTGTTGTGTTGTGTTGTGTTGTGTTGTGTTGAGTTGAGTTGAGTTGTGTTGTGTTGTGTTGTGTTGTGTTGTGTTGTGTTGTGTGTAGTGTAGTGTTGTGTNPAGTAASTTGGTASSNTSIPGQTTSSHTT